MELKPLDRAGALKRLMQEPLLQRLYWYGTLRGRRTKTEFKLLTEGVDDEKILDAQIVLAKQAKAASDAAMRYYGYPGHEHMSWEANVNRMLAEASECPVTLVTHAFDYNLMMLR